MFAKRVICFRTGTGSIKIPFIIFLDHNGVVAAGIINFSLHPFICRFMNICLAMPQHAFCLLHDLSTGEHADSF